MINFRMNGLHKSGKYACKWTLNRINMPTDIVTTLTSVLQKVFPVVAIGVIGVVQMYFQIMKKCTRDATVHCTCLYFSFVHSLCIVQSTCSIIEDLCLVQNKLKGLKGGQRHVVFSEVSQNLNFHRPLSQTTEGSIMKHFQIYKLYYTVLVILLEFHMAGPVINDKAPLSTSKYQLLISYHTQDD